MAKQAKKLTTQEQYEVALARALTSHIRVYGTGYDKQGNYVYGITSASEENRVHLCTILPSGRISCDCLGKRAEMCMHRAFTMYTIQVELAAARARARIAEALQGAEAESNDSGERDAESEGIDFSLEADRRNRSARRGPAAFKRASTGMALK
jgi:hypothetical protein